MGLYDRRRTDRRVVFKGLNVHPGYAKDKMLNASLLAVEFASWLPVAQRPEHTTGYEGFFHLTGISGTVEEASLSYIIRDHVRTAFERKKELLHELVKRMNEMHPGSTTLELRDQYYNMREKIEPEEVHRGLGVRRHEGSRCHTFGEADPWRYGRCSPFFHGTALPEYLRRRVELPRTV